MFGTVVALYVLAVGINGLQLAGSPRWVDDLFYGLALLLAVALSQWEKRAKRRAGRERGRRDRRRGCPARRRPQERAAVVV
ncbi:hypothetical protein [Agromyces sp. H66]|uniref:hypothetical protein n=1 Tax=Agromyces sp. H66 TaxID=2529859 RepID=UPI0010A9C860|nr:hypothetical protein [Agromyces sp. H66]